jgi:hypothetical protein
MQTPALHRGKTHIPDFRGGLETLVGLLGGVYHRFSCASWGSSVFWVRSSVADRLTPGHSFHGLFSPMAFGYQRKPEVSTARGAREAAGGFLSRIRG